MKIVCLLRHADADERRPGQEDADRVLSGRGRVEARTLTERLERDGIVPELVLCSPARRAVETIEPSRDADALARASIEFDDELYLASSERLLARLSNLDDAIGCVLVVAHNPGIGILAEELVGGDATEARAALRSGFPPAALAVLEFETDRWIDVDRGRGRIVGLRRAV